MKVIFVCFLLNIVGKLCIGQADYAILNSSFLPQSLYLAGKQKLTARQFDSAVYLFNKTFTICKSQREYLFATLSLLNIAHAYSADGIIDSADRYLQKLSSIKKNYRIWPDQFKKEIYFLKGHVFYIRNNSDSAEYFLNKAFEIASSHPPDSLNALILKDLGNLSLVHFDYDKADELYNHAMDYEMRRDNPDDLIISSLYQNLSIVFAKRFEYEKAVEYLKKSIYIKEKILDQDDILLIKAYINFSQLLVEHRSFKKALDYSILVENIIISKYSSSYYLLGSIYQNRSIIYHYLGQVNKAYLYLDKAERIISNNFSNDYPLLNRVRLNLAMYYFSINDIDKTLQQLDLIQKYSDPSFVLLLNTLKSKCLIKKCDYNGAEEYLQKSIDLLHSSRLMESQVASYIYFTYGNYLKEINKIQEAEEFISLAIDIQNRNKNNTGFYDLIVFNNAGNFYYDTKKYYKAISYFKQGINRFYLSRNDTSLYPTNFVIFFDDGLRIAESYEGLAKSYLNLYKQNPNLFDQLQKSKEAIKKAIQLINSIQINNINNINIYSQYLGEISIFNLALEIYLESYNLNKNKNDGYKLFEILEKSKSTNLRLSINDLAALEYSNIPQKLVIIENRYKSLLKFYNQKISDFELNINEKETVSELYRYKDLRFNILNKYDSLINYFEKEYPDYYALRYNPYIASINDIQNKLDDNSVLLNYFIADSVIIVGIVGSTNFEIKKIKIDTSTKQSANYLFRSIKTGGSTKDITQICRDLYNILIYPIYNNLCGKKRIIIIPDGELYHVPFELLIDGKINNFESTNFNTLNYLIKEYAISYHYSASLWSRIKTTISQCNNNNKRRFLGVAPVYFMKNSMTEELQNSRTYRGNEITSRSKPFGSKIFKDLPYSREEVQNISKLFEEKGFSTTLLFDSIATEVNFKLNLKNANFIHIATHGFSNDENPELSGLAMYPSSKSQLKYTDRNFSLQNSDLTLLLKESNDDILYAGEMFNLDLSAELMVLSACESGVGQVVKGEGMIALTRGLIYSGAKNIVYTLWKISDKHTEKFMLDFYTHILNGKSYSEALRQAKLSMIENPSTAFPKLWAGYMLIGN